MKNIIKSSLLPSIPNAQAPLARVLNVAVKVDGDLEHFYLNNSEVDSGGLMGIDSLVALNCKVILPSGRLIMSSEPLTGPNTFVPGSADVELITDI